MLAWFALSAALTGAAAPPAPSPETRNVAAFARLYGVVRYFYPSDAAAEVDWNRFAVLGVSRVRTARNRAELATTLRTLVAPLGPGIAVGRVIPPAPAVKETAEPLVAWRYLGAAVSGGGEGPYAAKRTHRSRPQGSESGFVTLMQTVPAQAHRGKTIRLSGQIRATAAASAARAALWLRVDRPNQAQGFFDNMEGRPVRAAEWQPYAIEGPVADDAEAIAFGVMGVGAVTADFGPVELSVRDAAGLWTPIAVLDPKFESAAAGSGQGQAWRRAGTGEADVSRPAQGGPDGGPFVRLAPPPAPAEEELFADGAPRRGAQADLVLGEGLRARVPLVLTDAEARPDPKRAGELGRLRAALAAPASGDASDLDQRLADVVVAWNVFRHFYPYWTETGVDWDARLVPRLEAARAARTRSEQRDVLRGLTADARDGHANVRDTLDRTERGELPVKVAAVDGRLVVVASAASEVPVGAVVWTVDGVPAGEWFERALGLASGTLQWRQVAALSRLMYGPKDGHVTLGVGTGPGPEARPVTLTYGPAGPQLKRPDPVTELEPGMWYVDLTRATMAQIQRRLDALAAAPAVVFDVRGYPTDAGAALLPHLVGAPEHDRWMHVPRIVGPFFQVAGWEHFGWNLEPKSPHIAGRAVFLTDGSAISYAESVMGYVADLKLGAIVGSVTAGTNGNVATFTTPGAFAIRLTGMRVTRHDGRSPHHLAGIGPTDPLLPTLDGLRAGRDEVLERGLALARARTPPAP